MDCLSCLHFLKHSQCTLGSTPLVLLPSLLLHMRRSHVSGRRAARARAKYVIRETFPVRGNGRAEWCRGEACDYLMNVRVQSIRTSQWSLKMKEDDGEGGGTGWHGSGAMEGVAGNGQRFPLNRSWRGFTLLERNYKIALHFVFLFMHYFGRSSLAAVSISLQFFPALPTTSPACKQHMQSSHCKKNKKKQNSWPGMERARWPAERHKIWQHEI